MSAMSVAIPRTTRPDAADASCRLPVLKLVQAGLTWLMVGLLLSLGASVVLHQPSLGGCEYFGYGRMSAAARVALTYGFALQLGWGVATWTLFRSTGGTLRSGVMVFGGALVWNVGVLAAVAGILLGESSGIPGFELPSYGAGILLAGYLLIAVPVIVDHGVAGRATRTLPQVMILAALVGFPWLLATAGVMLVAWPARGVLTGLVAAWYSQGLSWGVLAPLTLATLWHLRNEAKGGPLPRPAFAALGFWSLLFLAGWTGASRLVGGPVPAWIASAGVVAGVLLLVPVVLVGANLFCRTGRPGGALAAVSGVAFVVSAGFTSLTSLRCAHRILHFTFFPEALDGIFLLGFVGLGLMASLYVILPRLVGFAWPRPELVAAHVGLSAIGLVLAFVPLAVGGWIQGYRLDVASQGLDAINAQLVHFLRFQTLGWLALLGGQVAFLLHGALMCARHLPMVKKLALGLVQEEVLTASATVRPAK